MTSPSRDRRNVSPGKRSPAARHEMLGESELVRQHRRRQRPFFGDDRRHRVTVTRITDRGIEQVGERQRAVALRQRRPTRNRARDRDRLPSALRHCALSGIARWRHRGRRAARRVEPGERPVRPRRSRKDRCRGRCCKARRPSARSRSRAPRRRRCRHAGAWRCRPASASGCDVAHRVARENGLAAATGRACAQSNVQHVGFSPSSWNASSRFLRNAGATISNKSSPP